MPAYVYIGNQLQIVILTYFRSHGYLMYTLDIMYTLSNRRSLMATVWICGVPFLFAIICTNLNYDK